MGSEEALPPELIYEILSRTSLGTLERSKEVCDDWKKIIYEATFLPLYRKRNHCLFGYFFQTITNNHQYSSVVVADADAAAADVKVFADMEILASSDQGILCCRRAIKGKYYRYYACKPTTKQFQALPNPKLRYETAAVAVVVVRSHPLHYIIVRLSEKGGMQYKCEVFDSDIWAWEKVECATPYGETVYPCLAGVTIGGSVHWLTTSDNVLTWDTRKYRMECFPLPETVRGNDAYTYKQLMDHEDGLGLRCSVENRMEVWVMAKGRREWMRKVSVDMTVVGENLKEPDDAKLWEPEAVEFLNTDVAFMKKGKDAVFYNIQCHRFHQVKVKVPYNLRYPKKIFRFRSDFERVDLKGGRCVEHEDQKKLQLCIRHNRVIVAVASFILVILVGISLLLGIV